MEGDAFISSVEKAAVFTVFLLMGLGFIQIVLGVSVLKSVALTANGIDCMGDGFVSAVVWVGLKFFRKPADSRFHYGYYKIENLASIVAAVIMFLLAGYIGYRAYAQFINPHDIKMPLLGAIIALFAAIIAWGIGIQKFLKGRKSGLNSVKLDAVNTIKDGTASFLAVVALLLAANGYPIADAIAGFIIATVIISIGFASMKEASYMLVDACDAECIVKGQEIKSMAEGISGVEAAHIIRLRRAGPVLQGEIEIEVQEDMSIREVNKIRLDIQRVAKEKFTDIERLSVIAVPHKKEKN